MYKSYILWKLITPTITWPTDHSSPTHTYKDKDMDKDKGKDKDKVDHF